MDKLHAIKDKRYSEFNQNIFSTRWHSDERMLILTSFGRNVYLTLRNSPVPIAKYENRIRYYVFNQPMVLVTIICDMKNNELQKLYAIIKMS